MTMTQQPDPLENLSRDDLLRVCRRDRWVKEMLSARLSSLVAENVELLAIVRDLQTEMSQIPQNGDVPDPQPVP